MNPNLKTRKAPTFNSSLTSAIICLGVLAQACLAQSGTFTAIGNDHRQVQQYGHLADEWQVVDRRRRVGFQKDELHTRVSNYITVLEQHISPGVS